MPTDFRRWFNSPVRADSLLHVCCETPGGVPATVTAFSQQVPPSDSTAGQHLESSTAEASAVSDGPHAGPSEQQSGDQQQLQQQGAAAGQSAQDTGGSKRQSEQEDDNSSGPVSKRPRTTICTVQQVRTYHTHAVVLCAQSDYFEASLSKIWQQQQQQQERRLQPLQQGEGQQARGQGQLQHSLQQEGHTDKCEPGSTCRGDNSSAAQAAPSQRLDELTVLIQHDELDAFDMVLRFMYGFDLPTMTPETIPLLLQCLRLADRFDVAKCMDVLLKRLESYILNATVQHFIFDAPPGVMSRPGFQALLGECKRYVVQAYGNVPVLMKYRQLWRFLPLPFSGVLALAESDELQVYSENCVVYLLSAWVKAAQQPGGQGVTAEQLEQLSQQVRVLHLGPAYQYHILPKLWWFKGCSGMSHLPTLLMYKGRDASGTAIFPAAGMSVPDASEQLPKQWVARPRQRARVTSAHQQLTWEVGGDELQQLQEDRAIFSPTLYLNGFMVGVVASAEHDEGAVTLGLYPGVDPAQQDHGIVWPSTASVPFGPVILTVSGGPEGGVSFEVEAASRTGVAGLGTTDILSGSARTMPELLAPYLRGGKLHVQARFTTVDQL